MSPGSPSQTMAALLRRGPLRWMSRQLCATFVRPPVNHWASGSRHSSTSVNGRNQCNSVASLPQNAAGSVAASFQSLWYSAREPIRAWLANSSDGGKSRSSFMMCKIVSGSCAGIS